MQPLPSNTPLLLVFSPRQQHFRRVMTHGLVLTVAIIALYSMVIRLIAPVNPLVTESLLSTQTAIALLLLAVGYVLEQVSRNKKDNILFKGFAAACYTAVMGGVLAHLHHCVTAGFIPLSPSLFPMTYCFLHHGMFLCLAYLALAHLLLPQKPVLSLLSIHFPALLLLNLCISGILQHLFSDAPPVPLFNFQAATCLCMMSIAMILLRVEFGSFLKPFFSTNRHIRYYALFIVLLWLGALLLETMQNLLDLKMVVNGSVYLFLRAQDLHLIMVTMLMIPVILVLHLLNRLEARQQIVASLQAAMEHHHMIAAMLSHDLKTPLETEIAAIEMIQQHPNDHPMAQNTRRILSAVNDNNRFELEMVSNLLYFFRSGIHAERFEPALLDVSDLLAVIQAEMLPLASRKNQTLDMQPPPMGLAVFADRTSLKRVLHNLINNAIKHLSSGHHIQVSVSAEDNTIGFSVMDNGPGLSEAAREHLFSFLSLHAQNHTYRNKSTGLGLYVAKQIVERHGGVIWAEESVSGGGTHIRFTLPRVPEILPEQEASPRNCLSVTPVLS